MLQERNGNVLGFVRPVVRSSHPQREGPSISEALSLTSYLIIHCDNRKTEIATKQWRTLTQRYIKGTGIGVGQVTGWLAVRIVRTTRHVSGMALFGEMCKRNAFVVA